MGTELQSIARGENGYLVRTRSDLAAAELTVDLVVHGAGRVPSIDRLDLAAAGIERTNAGIR